VERERESLAEDASVELTFPSLHLEFSRREMVKLKVSLTPRDQEDLDQREPLTLEKLSFLERPTMSENTLLEDRLERRMEKLSTKPPTSKDSSPRRELEERLSTRETELMPGNQTKKLTSLTRSSSLNILRKRKLPRKPLSQLQLPQLPQLKLQQPPRKPRKPLQPRKPMPQLKLQQPPRKPPQRRSE